LFWYFLIHHVFNEVYLRQRFCPIEGNDSVLALRSTALILHVLAYLTLIRGPIGVSNDYIAPLIMALGLSFLVYIGLLVRLRSNLTFATLANNVVLELVVLGLLPLAVTIGITFEQVVCYHFVFWALMPTLRIPQSGTPWFVGYAVLAITTTVLFLAISPIGFRSMQIPVYLFSTQFILWSYAHITLSFVVSSAHPVWIRTWFEPKAQIPG
jgi:hypothetical protein